MSPTVSSLLSLLFVLALIPITLWIARRFMAGGTGTVGPGPIRIRATATLGPRERIVIVEAAGKNLLVGITAQSMQTLAEFENAPQFDEAEAPAFASLLKGIRRS
ncbi:MAG: flagellar biosynthetic protein FliO [Burkholderiaceae bacterium]